MASQTDVTPRMRAILIDWMVEVHLKFKLQAQTLYIAVNVLDRFLERKIVVRDELQLIGCTALWTASKIEEIYAPEVQDFVLISDRAFKRSDLLAMEGQMLNVLGFTMTFPTHYIFLTRFARVVRFFSFTTFLEKRPHAAANSSRLCCAFSRVIIRPTPTRSKNYLHRIA